jgi:hypothetical protein
MARCVPGYDQEIAVERGVLRQKRGVWQVFLSPLAAT